MPLGYVKKILSAQVYDAAIETPLESARSLSARFNNNVLIKREDLQPVFSFKIRGAYNKLASLSSADKRQGVIAASAGNHAQGLAYSASKLGIAATIVMPQTTPVIKVDAVRAYGADVVLFGDTYDEAAKHSKDLVESLGLVYIHPFDDPEVIAGQGTIGLELMRQHTGPIEAIFIPVGGGGLIAGVAAYVKYLRPEIKIIGVESDESACLKAALDAGERVVLPQVGIFADGVAVRQIGLHTWDVCKGLVDEVITCNADEICAGIKDIYDDTRAITEPSGALAIAGMKKYIERSGDKQKTFITINSGANMNFDRLRYIAERTEIGEKREAVIAATISEEPGSFLRFCRLIGKRSITEFNYRYAGGRDAHIYVGLSVSPAAQGRAEVIDFLRDHDYQVIDLTDNECAKLHVRHMVGGHSPAKLNELIFRFEFPERPGALLSFLSQVGSQWNISMFHYRNHGAAYGRVLVGFHAQEHEQENVKKFLEEAGYSYWDETDNPALSLFLSN